MSTCQVTAVSTFNVLIVEDNKETITVLEKTLKDLGCWVEVMDRQEAEDFASRRTKYLNAILVDLNLGNKQLLGLQVAQSMKTWYPFTPVVIVTAFSKRLITEYTERLQLKKEALPLYVDSVVPKDGLIDPEDTRKWFEELHKQSRLTCGEIVEVSEGYVRAVSNEEVRLALETTHGLEEVSLDRDNAQRLGIERQGQPVEMTLWRTYSDKEQSSGARVEFRPKAIAEEEKRMLVEPS